MVSLVLPNLQIELEETTYFSWQVISVQQLALDIISEALREERKK
jgi:hypothetical protein